MVDIANALGVNVEWLANGVGEMEGPSSTPPIRADRSHQIPIWNEHGETDDFVMSPKGKPGATWRAYILKGTVAAQMLRLVPSSLSIVP